MTITLYGKDPRLCPGCSTTAMVFKKNGVVPEKVMVDEDESALDFIRSLGYQEVPVVVVTDNEGNILDHWSRFRIEKIKEYAAK